MAVGNEQIDERILRLIGLEDVFDIDYDTYITLLKEAMVKGRMSNTKIPTEEIELVTDEYKRLKSKKGKGRFTIRKKSPITADKLGIGKSFKISQKQLALPAAIAPKDSGDDTEVLKNIDDLLKDIRDNLTGLNDAAKEKSKLDQKERENRKRREREDKLEKKPFEGIKKVADAIIAPVKSLFERLFDFIGKVILGRILFKIVEWFGNPQNQDKIKSIVRFLKDWWPALLGTYILFGTKFGKFVRTISRIVIRSIPMLLKATKSLLKFIGRNKVGAAVALGAAAVGTGAMLLAGGDDEKEPNIQPQQKLYGGGLVFPRLIPRQRFDGGALVRGPGGVDKVPAWLTNGEFVVSKGAVDKHGVEFFERLNASGGGTNEPTIVDNEMYAAGGGYVGTEEEKKERVKDPILEKRVRSQLQAQKALASGKGVNIKGVSTGLQLGTGYGAKYKGKDSIVIKNGGVNFSTGIGDNEITLGGRRYFAMKRGNDVIYTPQDSRDRGTGGLFQPGGMFGGPRMSARMNYAASKGKYYSSSDQKTYGNYNDALAARNSRLTSLASQQRLDKLKQKVSNPSNDGYGDVSDWTNAGIKAQAEENKKRGGFFGQLNRSFTGTLDRLAGGKSRYEAADKASTARVKQAQAASINRYYSSSDGKYYKDYAAAKLARDQRRKSGVKPPPPKSKPKPQVAGGGMGGRRGSGAKPSTSNVPSGSAAMPGGTRRAEASLGVNKK